MPTSSELPTLPFESKKKFADWLAKNHDKSAGVWLKIAKKATGIPTVTYAVLWRIQTAKKPETRAKRISQLTDMLERGEKLHP